MIPPLSRIGPVLPIVIVSVKVMLPCLDCAQSLGLSQTNSLYSQLPDQRVYPIIFNRRWGYLSATFLNLLDTPLSTLEELHVMPVYRRVLSSIGCRWRD